MVSDMREKLQTYPTEHPLKLRTGLVGGGQALKRCKCLSLSTFEGLNRSWICSSVVLNAVKGVLCVSALIMLYLWDKTLFRWPSPPELLPVLAEVTDGSSSLFP